MLLVIVHDSVCLFSITIKESMITLDTFVGTCHYVMLKGHLPLCDAKLNDLSHIFDKVMVLIVFWGFLVNYSTTIICPLRDHRPEGSWQHFESQCCQILLFQRLTVLQNSPELYPKTTLVLDFQTTTSKGPDQVYTITS